MRSSNPEIGCGLSSATGLSRISGEMLLTGHLLSLFLRRGDGVGRGPTAVSAGTSRDALLTAACLLTSLPVVSCAGPSLTPGVRVIWGNIPDTGTQGETGSTVSPGLPWSISSVAHIKGGSGTSGPICWTNCMIDCSWVLMCWSVACLQ